MTTSYYKNNMDLSHSELFSFMSRIKDIYDIFDKNKQLSEEDKRWFRGSYEFVYNKKDVLNMFPATVRTHNIPKIDRNLVYEPLNYTILQLISINQHLAEFREIKSYIINNYTENEIERGYNLSYTQGLEEREHQLIFVQKHLFDVLQPNLEYVKKFINDNYTSNTIIDEMNKYYKLVEHESSLFIDFINELIMVYRKYNRNDDTIIEGIISRMQFMIYDYTHINLTKTLIKSKLCDDNIKEKLLIEMKKEFFKFAKKRYFRTTEHYLLRGLYDINVRDDQNETLLEKAIKANHGEMVKTLLENGADIPNFHYLVYYLCKNNKEILKVFMKYNVNMKDSQEDTLIHSVLHLHDSELFKELLSYRPNIDIQNSGGRTPLMNIIPVVTSDVYMLLIDHYKQNNIEFHLETKDNEGRTALHNIVLDLMYYDNDKLSAVKALVEMKANINSVDKKNISILDHLIGNGKIELIQYFLDQNIKINNRSMYFAYQPDKYDILELLLNYGAKPTKEILNTDNKQIINAVIKNNPELLDEMLLFNIKNDRKDIIKFLLSMYNNDKTLYLHEIANFNFDTESDEKAQNRNEIFNLLLDDRTNIAKENKRGNNVLDIINKNKNHVLFKAIREFNVKSRL